MSKKTKWIISIVAAVLLGAGAIMLAINEAVPTTDGDDVTPDTAQVDSVCVPMVDSLAVDTAAECE